MKYIERFKKEHPQTPIVSSRNKDKDFEELCALVGPPSRVMRWCCTIFKTGAIQRKIKTMFRNKNKIITFYGIRRNESASRNKYERETEGSKITKQITISPIIDWMDFDVWLYMLTTEIDFNYAYRLGMQELAAGVVLITVVGQSFCLRFICLNSPKDSDSFWLTLQQRLENLIRKCMWTKASGKQDRGKWRRLCKEVGSII